jgi:cobalamin biosynthesis protein CobD/CbiB
MRAFPDAPDRRDRTDRLLVFVGTAFAALAVLLTAVVLAATLPLGALGGPVLAPVVFALLLVAVALATSRLGRQRARAASSPELD